MSALIPSANPSISKLDTYRVMTVVYSEIKLLEEEGVYLQDDNFIQVKEITAQVLDFLDLVHVELSDDDFKSFYLSKPAFMDYVSKLCRTVKTARQVIESSENIRVVSVAGPGLYINGSLVAVYHHRESARQVKQMIADVEGLHNA